MYLCYVDETGMDEDSDAIVTVGIVVDATTRLVKVNREWAARVEGLREQVGANFRELKSRAMYQGSGYWSKIDGPDRAAEIASMIDWFCDSYYKIALASADKAHDVPDLDGIKTLEGLCFAHVLLQVQRAHQGKKKNKGQTLLVADESKIQGETVDFLLDPPEWADRYYQRGKKQDPFDQLVHTPFYVKSHHVGIVQLADLVAFVYRQYLQVVRHGEAYDGELDRLTGWVERLNQCLLPPAARTPKLKSGPAPKLIGAVSPGELP